MRIRLPFGIAPTALIPRPLTGCRKVSTLAEAKSGQNNFKGFEANKVTPLSFAAPSRICEYYFKLDLSSLRLAVDLS